MARLPITGTDDGQWGTLLNEFLKVSHNADGTPANVVANVAGLKAMSPSDAVKFGTVYVTGYYAVGDGGEGVFCWNGSSVVTDNGGTVIALTVGGAGRWTRQGNGTRASVKWFGAVGDGVADDTTALQAACNASLHVNFGSPADIYRVNGTLALRSGHVLDVGGATVRQYGYQTPLLDATGKADITIQGGTFVGLLESPYVNSPSSLAIGLTAWNASNVLVQGNKFRNFCYSPVMVGVGGNGFTFVDNDVVGPGVAILSDINYRNCTGVTVTGANILIANNRITQTAQGLIIGQGSENVVVSGNLIHDIVTEHGMYCDTGLKNLSITGNTVRAVGHTGIKVQHYDAWGTEPSDVSITGNSVQGTTRGDGILVLNSAPAGTFLKLRGLSVSGNTCRDIGQDGISVRCAVGASISGNTVYVAGRNGIFLSNNEDMVINGNLLRQTQENGICDDGTSRNVAITANNLYDTGRAGIDLNGRSSGILIAGGTDRHIQGNYVKGDPAKMQYGLYIADGTQTSMVVQGNYLGGAKDFGARFKSPPEPLKYFGENKLEGGGGNDAGYQVPEALQRGTQENIYYGTAVPASGTWPQGAVVYSRYPAAGGYMGWVCVVGGSPGTWRTFGPVTA